MIPVGMWQDVYGLHNVHTTSIVDRGSLGISSCSSIKVRVRFSKLI